METESKKKISYRTEFIVAVGYIIFFCVLVIACLVFSYINLSRYSPPTNVFATDLPPATPIPHVSFDHQFNEDSILFSEEFNNNENHWLNSENDIFERIDNGKLIFQSIYSEYHAIITCETCPEMESPYYLETSLSTKSATDRNFGIVFKGDYAYKDFINDFYLFSINLETKKYFLFHCTLDECTIRASGESPLIRPYPESNTLGLYVGNDFIELYINGTIVDSYMESGTKFYPGYFGIYMDNSEFYVLVDNVVVYKIGE